jgi:hypothetical protein
MGSVMIEADVCLENRSEIMKRWIPLLTLLLVLTVVLLLASAAMACPMCKESVNGAASDTVHGGGFFAGDGTVSGGFKNSIYLMLVGFFSAVGLITFNLVRAIRK